MNLYDVIMEHRTTLITAFVEYNSQINLSAIRAPQDIYNKHIVDALEVVQLDIIKPQMLVADIGTGGGWPLLALAQSYPETKFVGIDATRKKVNAVQGIADQAWLTNISTQRWRVEDLTGSYDIITARAVAYADVLLDWIHPLLKPGWAMILYKLSTEEENKYITRRCGNNHYDITYEHHYQLAWDETARIIRVLTKHRSHQQKQKDVSKKIKIIKQDNRRTHKDKS